MLTKGKQACKLRIYLNFKQLCENFKGLTCLIGNISQDNFLA
jgi:hypothetical protein